MQAFWEIVTVWGECLCGEGSWEKHVTGRSVGVDMLGKSGGMHPECL